MKMEARERERKSIDNDRVMCCFCTNIHLKTALWEAGGYSYTA